MSTAQQNAWAICRRENGEIVYGMIGQYSYAVAKDDASGLYAYEAGRFSGLKKETHRKCGFNTAKQAEDSAINFISEKTLENEHTTTN